MNSSYGARKNFLGGALALLVGAAVAPDAAWAQGYYYYPPDGGYGGWGGYAERGYDDPWGGPPRQARGDAPYASRRAISEALAEEGCRLVGRLDFQGGNIVATGVDEEGRRLRFVIDPYDGEILESRRLTRQAARPDMGAEENGPDGARQRPMPRPREERPKPPVARLQPPTAPSTGGAPATPPPHTQAVPQSPRPAAQPAAAPPAPGNARTRDEPPPPPAEKSVTPRSAAAPPREQSRSPAPTGSSHRAIVPPPGAQRPPAPPQASAVTPAKAAPSAPPPAATAAPAQPSPAAPPIKWADPGARERGGGAD